jgi:hypothetical protein
MTNARTLLTRSKHHTKRPSLLLALSFLIASGLSLGNIPSAFSQSSSSNKLKHEQEKAAAAAERAKERQEEAAAKAAAAAARKKLEAEEAKARAAARAAEEAAKAAAEAARHKHSAKAPTTFLIANYGAVGDGKTDDTAAINRAIAAAVSAKGGTVTAGNGTYLFSGPITVPDGVTLTALPSALVVFQPTQSGAAFIMQGKSCISYCTFGAQPGDSGYNVFTQDPTPTQRSVYATPGSSPSLISDILVSVCCIDCNAINVVDCAERSSLDVYGSQNILIQNCLFLPGLSGTPIGTLNIFPDSAQKQSVGLSLVSCTWNGVGSYRTAGNIYLGGGIAKGASQIIQGCNFNNNVIGVSIANDNSPAQTYFSFAKNTFSGGAFAETSSLYLSNSNPNVVVSVNGNSFNAVAAPGTYVGSASISNLASGSKVGSVSFTDNLATNPAFFCGGNTSITGNSFSKLGQIQCVLNKLAWVGPLNITGNSFSISGSGNNAYGNPILPILVELSSTDNGTTQGPIVVENNPCTSSVSLPGYIIILDAANDLTNLSGNTINPAGAIMTVVNTLPDFLALEQQVPGETPPLF